MAKVKRTMYRSDRLNELLSRRGRGEKLNDEEIAFAKAEITYLHKTLKQPLSMEETAIIMDTNRMTVCRLEKSAMQKLRKALAEYGINSIDELIKLS